MNINDGCATRLATVDECAVTCSKTRGCKYFTYEVDVHGAGSTPCPGACWLKYRVSSSLEAFDNAITGLRKGEMHSAAPAAELCFRMSSTTTLSPVKGQQQFLALSWLHALAVHQT
eukprot:GHRQ01014166.1.p1 GENE.GHRQ01014166.1~~GHRQ01014166.1.p1  ORF type:complete len:116 (+),score=18.05 GHRQ01014166.1:951-1298(+)